jgi:AraC-like DNA-binding protein
MYNHNETSPRQPERESEFNRHPDLGYEEKLEEGFIRFLEHGAPHPLIRWHFHEEFELHLITSTFGKVFVGDYIGNFQPGQLVMTGPHLPHNWISTDYPDEGEKVAIRDKVLQFNPEPLHKAAELIPELRQVLPFLERAANGIEFYGISSEVERLMDRIKVSGGLQRMALFTELLAMLSQHQNYRLLSSVQMQSRDNQKRLDQISEIVDYVTENFASPFSMAEVAEKFGMSESRFSRYFRKATGNTFTDFVNRIRINKASMLLLETEQYISTICYNVGFNNVANFNRRFMEVRGVTPSEFRRNGKLRY